MPERSVISGESCEETERLSRLPDGGLQYLSCNGIANNPTTPEYRRVMFKQLAADIFENMPKPDKDQLIEYITWKSNKLFQNRTRQSLPFPASK